MKKIIGIIGAVAFVMIMFMTTSAVSNSNGNIDLASLLTTQEANAECGDPPKASSANATCTASGRCRHDTTDRECHL